MERGMKKWAPYKTLTDQYEKLYELRKEREKIEKPRISQEKADEINEILVNYQNEELKITYYKKGEIIKLISPIFKIDAFNKTLILVNGLRVEFKNLLDLERI